MRALLVVLVFLVTLLAVAAIPYAYAKYEWFVATNYYFTAVTVVAGLLVVVAFATRQPNR